jgi:hypothetical protein
MMKLGTCFLFMFSILDCFEFFSIYYRNDYGTNMDVL